MIGRLRSLAVRSLTVLLAAGSTLWAQGDSLRAVPAQGLVSHAWKPVRRGGNGVVAIEVRTDIDSLPAEAMRAFSLSVPITDAGVTGIAERTQRLVVRDTQGSSCATTPAYGSTA